MFLVPITFDVYTQFYKTLSFLQYFNYVNCFCFKLYRPIGMELFKKDANNSNRFLKYFIQ